MGLACDRPLVPKLRPGMLPKVPPPLSGRAAFTDTEAEPEHQILGSLQRALCTEQPQNTPNGPFKIPHH